MLPKPNSDLPCFILECLPKGVDPAKHTLNVAFRLAYVAAPTDIRVSVQDESSIMINYDRQAANQLLQLTFYQTEPFKCGGEGDALLLLGLFFKHGVSRFKTLAHDFPFGVTNASGQTIELSGFPVPSHQPARRAALPPFSMSIIHRLPNDTKQEENFSLIFCDNQAMPYRFDPTIVNDPS